MKKNLTKNYFLMLWLCFAVISSLYAATSANEMLLNAKSRENTVNAVVTVLEKNYILPDKANAMSQFLQNQLQALAYNNINNPQVFADKLTSDLRTINDDKHLSIIFDPQTAREMKDYNHKTISPSKKKKTEWLFQQANYGFNEVKILPGNVGYINFTLFADPEISKGTIAAAMQFVNHSNAIIFDLRDNHGGEPTAIQLICSYLFSDKPVHLNDQYFRDSNKTQQFWTLKHIDGKRIPNIPVYILTSHSTFSAAEEFTYDLKNLKRATIVGETTGGGAHMVKPIPINDGFIVNVPYAQAINPITKTNWEGTGVVPNIEVPAEQALMKAHMLALENIAKIANNDDVKRQSLWILDILQGLNSAPEMNNQQLQHFVGTYGENNHITYHDGKLFYQKSNIADIKQIIPISNTTFVYKDMAFFPLTQVKLHFDVNSKNEVQSLVEQHLDLPDQYYPKSD